MTTFYKWKSGRFGQAQSIEIASDGVRHQAKDKTRQIGFASIASAYWSDNKSFGLQSFSIVDTSGVEVSISSGLGVGRESDSGSFHDAVIAILRGLALTQPEFQVVLGYSPRMTRSTLLTGVPILAGVFLINWLTDSVADWGIRLSFWVFAAVVYVVVVVRQSGGLRPKKTTARQLADALSGDGRFGRR